MNHRRKNLALTMFYKSPATYNFLRLQNLNLPGPSTVRVWIGQSKFLPGFNKIFMTHLKKKKLSLRSTKKRLVVFPLMKFQ